MEWVLTNAASPRIRLECAGEAEVRALVALFDSFGECSTDVFLARYHSPDRVGARLLLDHQHSARSMVENLGRHAAVHQTLGRALSPRSDHEQIGIMMLDGIDQSLGRIALHDVILGFCSALGHDRASACEF